ncbi:hypothetical protein Ahy_A06g027421 [Arachis hypogaea]|uniref:Uncharacterized protein n=1 Tax=Arachis hypogaea TaxID=3818 RepID=A0A445CNL9_ARAHY|nr:hypothetical protein Ahy_A06g027421 [Arachis hypogaea]
MLPASNTINHYNCYQRSISPPLLNHSGPSVLHLLFMFKFSRKAKPKVKKWMRTPIKHYDKLFEIYGTDRATEKHAKSEKHKETINLNDDDSFLNIEDEWNNELITPNATSFIMEIKRMSQGIQALTEIMKDGNHFYERSINIAKKEDRVKREFFGVPADVRLATLYELMKEARVL